MENELPEGWERTHISNLIPSDGIFNDGDWVESKDQDVNGDVRLIQLADVGVGYFRNRSDRYLTSDKAIELDCTFLSEGDILIARMPDPLGRACIFPLVGKNVTVVDVAIIRCGKNGVINQWLMHTINSGPIREKILELASGSTRTRISRKNLAGIEIPLPPLAEQTRIVAKLDVAFAHLETLKTSLSRIPELLKQFRQTVLSQAVTGKLTEDWREDKSFDVERDVSFIKRTRVERYEAELQRFINQGGKKPRKVNFEECEYESNVDGWKILFIEEIFDIETGATPKRDVKKYWENGTIPWLKSGQVSNSDITEADEFITETALVDTNTKLYPYNSILIAMYGEGKTRGQVGILKFEATSNQAIAAMVNPSLSETTIKFVFYFGLSQYEEIRKEAAGGNQPNLNTGKIREWKIDFPPLEEQQEIVRRVEALFAQADALEAQHVALKAKIDKLPQALLAKAFRGELVPQDPDDESASVLLGKIKAATVSVGGRKKSGQTRLSFADE